MLIYLFILCVLAVIPFLIQVQLYNDYHHETSETDYHDEITPIGMNPIFVIA